jgi:hypothetical protein
MTTSLEGGEHLAHIDFTAPVQNAVAHLDAGQIIFIKDDFDIHCTVGKQGIDQKTVAVGCRLKFPKIGDGNVARLAWCAW